MDKHEIRHKALLTAIDYHSRTWGAVNYQSLHTQHGGTADRRPTQDEVIGTAEKFLGFLTATPSKRRASASGRGGA